MLPEMMAKAGGLADNFDAKVTSATIEPWNYAGKRDYSLFVRLKLEPTEDSGLSEEQIEKLGGDDENSGQFYSLQKMTMTSREGETMNTWLPSEDGITGIEFEGDPAECVGYYAVPTEEYEEWWFKTHDKNDPPQLFGGSNWSFFMQKLIDAEFPSSLIKQANGSVQFLEGAVLHFARVAPPPRPGMAQQEGEQRKGDNKILVVTDVVSLPGAKGKGKVAGKAAGKSTVAKPAAKAAGKAASNGGGDVNELVEAAIVAHLEEAGEAVKRRSLYKVATSAVEKPSDKKAALALMADDDFFLGSELFELDTDDDTVSLIEA